MRGQRQGSAFSGFKEKARSFVERQRSPPTPQNLRVIMDHSRSTSVGLSFTLHEQKSTVVQL
jgi:hypothetical protein